ncbi:MAG TPA: tetratricopeptide repeat protein [Opitutaceae bacterium]|nr:tetratricopeptide repeat protein [Opitutaceae bacterium]
MRSLLLLLFIAAVAKAAVSPEKIETIRGLLRDHKVAEAESATRAVIAADPNEAEGYALLGSISLAKGDPNAAVTACEKAVELAPQNSEYRRQLGEAYGFTAQKAGIITKMSWAKKCRLAYEKAVELDPQNLNARSSLMMFYQQAPGIIGGSAEKAYAQAGEIKKIDASQGRTAYAMLYIGEKKYAEAFTELEEALKAAPENYLALYQFGRLAGMTGERMDHGVEALQKCLTLSPPPGAPGYDAVHWRLGNLRDKQGDKKAARAAYEAALAINPGYQQASDALKKLDAK